MNGNPLGDESKVVIGRGPGSLEVRTDTEVCMGSGNCHFLEPLGFDLDDDGRVQVLAGVPDDEERLRRVAEGCPVHAISVFRDGRQVAP